jgi:hypothetical protein
MADTIESIYQDFTVAMDAYSQAVTAIDNAMIELRAAERKLQAVFEAYAEFMGEYNPELDGFNSENTRSLFGRFTGSKSLNSLFDIGSLF